MTPMLFYKDGQLLDLDTVLAPGDILCDELGRRFRYVSEDLIERI